MLRTDDRGYAVFAPKNKDILACPNVRQVLYSNCTDLSKRFGNYLHISVDVTGKTDLLHPKRFVFCVVLPNQIET